MRQIAEVEIIETLFFFTPSAPVFAREDDAVKYWCSSDHIDGGL